MFFGNKFFSWNFFIDGENREIKFIDGNQTKEEVGCKEDLVKV